MFLLVREGVPKEGAHLVCEADRNLSFRKNRTIISKNPKYRKSSFFPIGDIAKIKVIEADAERKGISLANKQVE